jgi:hypothetical protein
MPGSHQRSPFPQASPQNPVHAPPLTHTCYMPRPSHSSRLITRTILGEEYRSLSSSFYSVLHFPVPSSLLGPNILLNTLFSNTLSLRSPLLSATKFHTHAKKTRQNYSSVYLNL